MSLRAPVPGLAAGEATLGREASRYLCRVLRLREGDRFVAFDPAAKTEAEGEITSASDEAAGVRFGPVRAAAVVADLAVELVYALAKGDKVDAVVRDATELAATRIVIARTSRAVAKVEGERADAKVERWRRVAEQAARQCGRADPPRVEGVLDWDVALASVTADARFVLDPHAPDALGPLLSEVLLRRGTLAFAIGPEGGLDAAELAEARARGFRSASLGRFVLRTETVAAAVLGAVRVLA
jgi:16S rRNA (uracil1498-N3)-methyltransferase